MTVIENVKKFFYVKSRPKPYKAKDAPYTVGGNRGAVLAAYPRDYPINAPQKAVRDAAKACGIKKGMDKTDLMEKMVDCIPDKYKSP